jgi:hypothetical protein
VIEAVLDMTTEAGSTTFTSSPRSRCIGMTEAERHAIDDRYTRVAPNGTLYNHDAEGQEHGVVGSALAKKSR